MDIPVGELNLEEVPNPSKNPFKPPASVETTPCTEIALTVSPSATTSTPVGANELWRGKINAALVPMPSAIPEAEPANVATAPPGDTDLTL